MEKGPLLTFVVSPAGTKTTSGTLTASASPPCNEFRPNTTHWFSPNSLSTTNDCPASAAICVFKTDSLLRMNKRAFSDSDVTLSCLRVALYCTCVRFREIRTGVSISEAVECRIVSSTSGFWWRSWL